MYKIINFKAMQKDLDTVISINKGLGMPYQNKDINHQIRVACWVELGELANEIEFFKYWKGNKRNDREKQLNEFADVMHFLLSLMNINDIKTYDVLDLMDIHIAYKCAKKLYPSSFTLTKLFDRLMKSIMKEEYDQALIKLCHVMYVLDFEPLELQLAYDGKHTINLKRQRENY